jgi:geranylgeranyl diphosphate synthase, type II
MVAMSLNTDLTLFAEIIERNGRAIMDRAISQVLDSNINAGVVSSAAKYHSRFLSKVVPVFPAIMNLSYEAAGGKTKSLIGVGSALTLFVEAANIHDDIIDQTVAKHKRKTTFGKFGTDISILAGDLVLVKAALSLSEETLSLSSKDRAAIFETTFQSLQKISKSAAKEALMHHRFDVKTKDYLEVIALRASVPEAHCMIGAILGDGDQEMVEYLGDYGRIYGVVGTIIDEFMDLLDYQKFCLRLNNEVVPLPLLAAMEDPEVKRTVERLQCTFKCELDEHKEIVELVLASNQTTRLKTGTLKLVKQNASMIDKKLKESKARRDLTTLLTVLDRLLCNF